ncbi:oxidoreductase [Seongchinamella unica]|uniref:Oxidoreductase n=1 Tax=Seongchinamella unica TaxID=2547392 RepID=A0A4V2ZX70_9GAMM|nr:PQQ-dependent sugar dehydrogenase [Seongchinamella unica]TDG13484.1 oxidoreductase [Seongchinamella unica]
MALVAALAVLTLAAFGIALGSGTISTSSLAMIANTALGIGGPPADERTSATFTLPPGFSLQLYADDVPRARFMRFAPNGDLVVSRSHAGEVILLRKDANGDGRHDGRVAILQGLDRPHGLDFHDGWLYVGERKQVGRIRFDDKGPRGDYQPVITGLTGNGNHWSKTLRFGPDDLLYLAQGSTCNICVEDDERRATIMRFKADGSNGEIFATGLRNSVGFDWAPWNNALYATDNGRDMLGDDFPVCELNRIEQGRFYGWPYFNDNNVPDPDMGADPQADSRQATAPVHGFAAHNAPLGISFVDSSSWPGNYERIALVALHGSWNRSTPDGYKVVSLHFGEAGIEERDFLSGFNRDGKIIGRPVDVVQGPDGAIYISDDYAGAIYRVSTDSPLSSAPAIVPRSSSRTGTSPPAWLSDNDLPEMSAVGEALYRQYHCASCHEQGENPVSLEGLATRMDYTAVMDTLRAPPPPMPLLPLDEQQLRALSVFLLKAGNWGKVH